MGIPNTCEISGCNNPPLIAYAGSWICGECMSKWNKINNMDMKRKMEKILKDGS
jgi:hypothetical protein